MVANMEGFVFKFRNLKFWCYAIDIYFVNFKAMTQKSNNMPMRAETT
jgi:hypothetical protein